MNKPKAEGATPPKTETPKPETRTCRNCSAKLRKGQYKLVADGVLCRDQPSCRQRALSTELGIDLFTRYPRERTLYEMDVRPAKYKEIKWQSIFTEDDRVMAGWIYFSWCYPVGLAYAVQIDADDEIMHDLYGQRMVMTQERLGEIMGIPQPNISRSTKRLEQRKLLRVGDAAVYPVAKPIISLAEREDISTDILGDLNRVANKAVKSIPPKYRAVLNDLLADAPEDIRTDIFGRVLNLCTAFNQGLKDIRTTRDTGIEQVCTETASLLSRPVTLRSSSSPRPRRTSRVPVSGGIEVASDDGGATLDELYAAGLGKGALAKLPPKAEQPAALIRARLAHWVAPALVDAAAADNLWRECQKIELGWTAAEVCALIDTKGEMARGKDKPLGFLLHAVKNLFDAGTLGQVRELQRKAKHQEDREQQYYSERSAAAAEDMAIEERLNAIFAAMSETELAERCQRWIEKNKAGEKGWQNLTKKQRMLRAESGARRELRAELEAEKGANGDD